MTDSAATRSGQFSLDGYNPTARFTAVRFGPRWNGHYTPWVTRQTLETLIHTEDPQKQWYELTFDAHAVAHIHYLDGRTAEEDHKITPDADGNYNLALLGWIFFDPDED